MRIESLKIRNMRIFGEEEQEVVFDSQKNVAIFLGNNGCGKTTILDALSIMLSPFISAFPGLGSKPFSGYDVHIREDGSLSDYLTVGLRMRDEGIPIVGFSSRKGMRIPPKSNISELKGYASSLLENILKNQTTALPILAYYGTGRGQIEAPVRKRNFQRAYNRWDCYLNALEPDTNFKRFFAWFDSMEDEERREREKRRDFDYHSPVLEAVRNAITAFVGENYQNPHIEIHPLRFVVDEVRGTSTRELRIEQLSDGFKIVTAMVADIASRMAEANPFMENPLLTSGIVLIDEMDLHLHPRWQRKILRQLCSTFPNVQFIVTTHSPIILLGAFDLAQVFVLDGKSIKANQFEGYSSYDVSQILLSDLIDVPTARSPRWDSKIQRRDELVGKVALSEREKAELKELDGELSGLAYGDSIREIEVRKMIYEIANKLGIKADE